MKQMDAEAQPKPASEAKKTPRIWVRIPIQDVAKAIGKPEMDPFQAAVNVLKVVMEGKYDDPGKPSTMRGRAHGWNMSLELQCLVFTLLAKPSRLVSIQACLELAGFPGLYQVFAALPELNIPQLIPKEYVINKSKGFLSGWENPEQAKEVAKVNTIHHGEIKAVLERGSIIQAVFLVPINAGSMEEWEADKTGVIPPCLQPEDLVGGIKEWGETMLRLHRPRCDGAHP